MPNKNEGDEVYHTIRISPELQEKLSPERLAEIVGDAMQFMSVDEATEDLEKII
jgi:hypothetical protein